MPFATDELSLRHARAGGLLRATLIFSVFSNLLMLTGPLFMLQVYDRVLASRSEETLVSLFGLVTALYALYGVLDWARGRVMARAAARYSAALGPRTLTAMIARSARQPGTPATTGPLSDLEAIRTLIGSPALLALFDIPWTPFFFLAIFAFHPLLGVMALAGGALLILIAVANQVLTRRAQEQATLNSVVAARFAKQAEHGGSLIRAQGMTGAITARWERMQAAAMSDSLSAQDRTGSFTSVSRSFRFFLQSAMLAAGAYLVLQGDVTGGAMIASSILLGRALAPIEQGLGQWAVIQRGRQARVRLAETLRQQPAAEPKTPLPRPDARLSVHNVGVSGGVGQPPLLSAIAFELSPGEALGVIGRSGAGKSTLARLVTGLLAPAAGEVRLGGATLDQYDPDALGPMIGYLPQEVSMFEGTIAENIARMELEPDPLKVVAAARRAGVHDVILRLPQGYDTRLREGDPRLSGGQKQRVALARALYGDPLLLVLDEPNSALDADGSDALNAAVVETKAKGGAVLIMTHRPTAISACDRLLILEGGRIAAIGPKDEIIRKSLRNANAVMASQPRRAAGGTS